LHPHSSTLFPYTTLFRSHTAMTDAESRAELEAKPDLLLRGADYVVAELLNSITDSYASQLLTLEYQVEKVEAQFFGGRFHHKDIDRKSTRLNSSHVKISY